MFRCPRLLPASCIIRTHRALLLLLKDLCLPVSIDRRCYQGAREQIIRKFSQNSGRVSPLLFEKTQKHKDNKVVYNESWSSNLPKEPERVSAQCGRKDLTSEKRDRGAWCKCLSRRSQKTVCHGKTFYSGSCTDSSLIHHDCEHLSVKTELDKETIQKADCIDSLIDSWTDALLERPPRKDEHFSKTTWETDLSWKPCGKGSHHQNKNSNERENIKCIFPKDPSEAVHTHCLYRKNTFDCLTAAHSHWLSINPCEDPSVRRLHYQAAQSSSSRIPLGVAALRECLSVKNEARCRQLLDAHRDLYEKEIVKESNGNKGWAAVLVSLCSVKGEPNFLFTLRSSRLKGRHKGDVSFAGGKRDPTDCDVIETALREAREELGIPVESERVWGILKPLRDSSGLMVAPVVANLGPIEALSFHPNPAEVEEIFTLSLPHLCNPDNRGYTHFRSGSRYGYTLPVFRNGKHRVWGLTAMALDQALKLIVPRECRVS
ncbi:mitochondrial coenzyme A diphosphatase NUDT8 [Amia ocellicauda]|uniref:mitochondrial coenzyme A diphosphatase NUDT8 n=1 Tax=Amia ocellicauda TaxID=2972642 RepID=UPI003464B6C9